MEKEQSLMSECGRLGVLASAIAAALAMPVLCTRRKISSKKWL
jgi:hypothetical protein